MSTNGQAVDDGDGVSGKASGREVSPGTEHERWAVGALQNWTGQSNGIARRRSTLERSWTRLDLQARNSLIYQAVIARSDAYTSG